MPHSFAQFLRFGLVGGLGFGWDTATVYLLRPLTGLTIALLSGYFVAATLNWLLHRVWTFRGLGRQRHILAQWLRFLAANSAGFCLNRGTVFAFCLLIPFCARNPVFPLAAGAVAGLGANFTLSRRHVFRDRPAP